MGYSPWGLKESDTTELTSHTHAHTYTTLSLGRLEERNGDGDRDG